MTFDSLFVPTVGPVEVIVRSAAVYAFLLGLFRIFGRAQQARRVGFDLAVMFLVGVSLRRTIVGDDDTLTSGFLAIATIFGLEWLASVASYRSGTVADILEGRPRKIMVDGKPVEENLRKTRLRISDVRERLREKGTDDLSRVREAWVERDGKITFLLRE